jgi:HAMP domain-containing protein
MRLRTLVLALLVLLILFLAFAWVDGGREQVRLIEQPVTLNGGAA